MRRAGAATVLPDAELSAARLATEVGGLLGDAQRLEGMAAASRGLARPDAARQIADQVLLAAGSPPSPAGRSHFSTEMGG